MVSHPETGSDSPIGSDRDRGRDKLTMPGHGTYLVVQRSLKIGATASEENWLRSNVFHTKCTSKDGFVWLLLIVGASRIVFPWRWCKSLI